MLGFQNLFYLVDSFGLYSYLVLSYFYYLFILESKFHLFHFSYFFFIKSLYRFYRMRFRPNDTDKARYNQKYRYEERAAFLRHIRPSALLRKRLPRSSYAFAQQEGWGPL